MGKALSSSCVQHSGKVPQKTSFLTHAASSMLAKISAMTSAFGFAPCGLPLGRTDTQCEGGRISMPNFGATTRSFWMSAGVTGTGGESKDGTGSANSSMNFSKPGGVTKINMRAGAWLSFLKACGIPRGPWMNEPGLARPSCRPA